MYDAPADARTREVVARTYSNRSGAYHFTELDRIAGKTQFKVLVDGGDGPREDGDFARRGIWSGNKVGYDTASAVTAAPAGPRLRPAGRRRHLRRGHQRGRRPAECRYAAFNDVDKDLAGGADEHNADGTVRDRATCGPATTP